MLTRTLLALVLTTAVAATTPAEAKSPYTKADGAVDRLSGTAVSTMSDGFDLDYGDGMIHIEMDDFDAWGDAHGLLDGDKVTVYGRIDSGLYENRTIEASSVYVQNLNSWFYASSADEEGDHWGATVDVVVSETSVVGTVKRVDLLGDDFVIDLGAQELSVDTGSLGYNPLDDAGWQKISVGDRVSVVGQMDRDFFEGMVLEADSVVTLYDADRDKRKKKKR